jgi:cell division protein FtsW
MKKGAPDYTLLATAVILLLIGIVMVFSSSYISALYVFKDPYHFLKKQLIGAVLSLIAMGFFMRLKYHAFRLLYPYILGGSILLLVAVLIPGIGKEINFSRRWIDLGFFVIQPSEIVKLAMIIYVACSLERKGDGVKKFFMGITPYLLLLGTISGLILLQPDLSTAVVIIFGVFLMIFIAGAKWGHMIGLGILGFAFGIAMIFSKEYRLKRLLIFTDPWKDPRGAGFQIIQSLYALGSGRLFGLGFGESRQKWFYIPEPQTDFIFSIIGEELGFIGGAFLILLFIIFIWRGFRIAMTAPDRLGCLLAAGITSIIGFQAFINFAVVTSSMPVTGIPLPFISYGSSSLIITLAGTGILLNISKYCNNTA